MCESASSGELRLTESLFDGGSGFCGECCSECVEFSGEVFVGDGGVVCVCVLGLQCSEGVV